MTRIQPVALTGDAWADVVREELATMFRKYAHGPVRGETPEFTLGVRIGHEAALRSLAWRLGMPSIQFDALKREVQILGGAYKDAPKHADQTDDEIKERDIANQATLASQSRRRSA